MKRLGHTVRNLVWLFTCFGSLSCDVEPTSQGDPGKLPPQTQCGRGLVVINSDFASTSVSLTDIDANVVTETLFSSSGVSTGVGTPLSGDVVLPSGMMSNDEIVLIDRFPNSTITWVSAETGKAIKQLSVSTGFASNPQDYAEISPTRAYVSRLEKNQRPGKQKYDSGSDVLVIDPSVPTIVDQITFEDDGQYLPRPARMIRVEGGVLLLLQRFDLSFSKALDSAIVLLSEKETKVLWSLELTGLANCTGLALAPQNKRIAVACTGVFAEDNQLARSGIAIVNLNEDSSVPPPQFMTLDVAKTLKQPVGPGLSFADENNLVGFVFGDQDGGSNDKIYRAEISTQKTTELSHVSSAFKIWDVRCTTPCSTLCMVTNAEKNALQLIDTENNYKVVRTVEVDTNTGLAPRVLGVFLDEIKGKPALISAPSSPQHPAKRTTSRANASFLQHRLFDLCHSWE